MMFAVRSIFASPQRVVAAMREAAAKGQVDKSLGDGAEPLDFLLHPGGAANITEAAYRFVRHEPGVDVVLFGTGDAGASAHQRRLAAEAALAAADRDKLADIVRACDRRRHGRRAHADRGRAARPDDPDTPPPMCAPPLRDVRKPSLVLPAKAADCHAHVFGPVDRYP